MAVGKADWATEDFQRQVMEKLFSLQSLAAQQQSMLEDIRLEQHKAAADREQSTLWALGADKEMSVEVQERLEVTREEAGQSFQALIRSQAKKKRKIGMEWVAEQQAGWEAARANRVRRARKDFLAMDGLWERLGSIDTLSAARALSPGSVEEGSTRGDVHVGQQRRGNRDDEIAEGKEDNEEVVAQTEDGIGGAHDESSDEDSSSSSAGRRAVASLEARADEAEGREGSEGSRGGPGDRGGGGDRTLRGALNSQTQEIIESGNRGGVILSCADRERGYGCRGPGSLGRSANTCSECDKRLHARCGVWVVKGHERWACKACADKIEACGGCGGGRGVWGGKCVGCEARIHKKCGLGLDGVQRCRQCSLPPAAAGGGS